MYLLFIKWVYGIICQVVRLIYDGKYRLGILDDIT